jgi:hypothetical protein
MNRVLLSKTDTKKGVEYKWKDTEPHDWMDAFSGCWTGAAFLGLSPSGIVKSGPKQRTRVAIGRPSQRR